jgi:hypothetical protein
VSRNQDGTHAMSREMPNRPLILVFTINVSQTGRPACLSVRE